jgi:septal ring factor EnvC (AmiA/AmiB activator)
MKKILSVSAMIILGVLLTLALQQFLCSRPDSYETIRKQYQAKIDSLQRVIEERNQRIIEIEEKIKLTETEITKLEQGIRDKDRQITYYKGKGRFDYVYSIDSLYAELNRLIKQRLAEVDSTADRLPR